MTHQTLRWKVLKKDLKPLEFTEGTDAMADGTPRANPEVSQKSRPHSTEHSIDEAELRKNRGKTDFAKTDNPSD